MSKLLQDATARLHEAELDKNLTEFHLKLSESRCSENHQSNTACHSDTSGDNHHTNICSRQAKPYLLLQQNSLSLLYYRANDFLFFSLVFFLISHPIVCKDAPVFS